MLSPENAGKNEKTNEKKIVDNKTKKEEVEKIEKIEKAEDCFCLNAFRFSTNLILGIQNYTKVCW